MTTPSDRARAAANLPPAADDQPGTEVALKPIDARIARLGRMEAAFAAAAPHGIEAKQLIRDAQTALRNIPDLVEATEASFFGALMTAAQLGLRPNVPALGHGWVLPFRNRRKGIVEAQWILGYQGMIELAERSGRIASVIARTIYSNEKYLVRYGVNEALEHVPTLDGSRGDPILHYAIARFTNGGVSWVVLSEHEVQEIKERSQSSGNPKSPWNTDRSAMARKSAIRQLFKFMPKSSELAFALEADEVVRTDLAPEALGVTLERVEDEGPEPDAKAAEPDGETPPERSSGGIIDGQVVDEGKPESVIGLRGEKPLRKYGSSALRKGLIQGVEQAAGERLWDHVAEVIGEERARAALAETEGDLTAALAYLDLDQLRAVLAAAQRPAAPQDAPQDGPPDDAE